MSEDQSFPKWVTIARWDGKNLDGYDLALAGFTSLYSGYPIQFNGSKYQPNHSWEVLLSESEYNNCSEDIKRLNKATSLIDKINQKLIDIVDAVMREDLLNSLEKLASDLESVQGNRMITDYPAIESLIVDLYNALLDSDSPLNH